MIIVGLCHVRVVPQLARREEHGQALAGPLRVPDDAASLAAGFPQPDGASNELVGRAKLLIPGDLLDRFALFRFEDDEVSNEVQQIPAVKQAIDRALHLVEGTGCWCADVGPAIAASIEAVAPACRTSSAAR